jgi:hypothetical protein
MSDEADHFRSRAKHCRDLAAGARHATDRQTLNEIADDLDAEAHRIDAVEASQEQAHRRHQDEQMANSLDRLKTSHRLLRETLPND